jgi:hypothetical protein
MEFTDRDVGRLLIVTQTAARAPKHDGHDRQGDWNTRTKITQDLEQVSSLHPLLFPAPPTIYTYP